MSTATQFGEKLEIGVGQTFGDYIVESINDGSPDVKSEDIDDEDGHRVTRIILQIDDKVDLTLIAKSGATPLTDWPKGGYSVVAGFTQFFVDDMQRSRSASAQRITVSLTNIGFTANPA